MHIMSAPVPKLLSTINNGIGGSTTLTYESSSSYNNKQIPFIVQTISSKTVNDGNGVNSTTTYDYSGGYYYPEEREFYGFLEHRTG